MTGDQADLLVQVRESLRGAKALAAIGLHGFGASRACYTMFYVAQGFLLGKRMAFSKHSAVHAAFGRPFAKTGLVPAEFHPYLLHGMEVRHAGDYGAVRLVTEAEAAEQIGRAAEFLVLAQRLIGPLPPDMLEDTERPVT